MKEYIFISNDYRYTSDITTIKISAIDKEEALTKAFVYFNCNELEKEEFNILCRNMSVEKISKTFERLTNQVIVYFAELSEFGFIDELKAIDMVENQEE